MLEILHNRTYARLFLAQVVALLGTGLLTIALGLLAFDLAGADAGRVLGLALTIKMVAYVALSPVATAVVARLDRRQVLIAADLIRMGIALCLPFVDAAWQIYVLIFVLQAASATFTPTYQALLPEVLPEEGAYTRALSLSRLAYDLENVASPVLAGLLLSVLAPSALFAGTALGFFASAGLVWSCRLPTTRRGADRPFRERLTRGTRIYLATPRLRGLLALNMAVSAVGAVVIVLSVVLARSVYGGGQQSLAVLLGAYGAGSMAAALSLPRVLDHLRDRPVMLAGAARGAGLMTGLGLAVLVSAWPAWTVLLLIWALIGAAQAAIMTPSGRLLRRAARAEDRPALVAAQFSLSHACWLLAYPAAGFLGSGPGVAPTMVLLGVAGLAATVLAARVWPGGRDAAIEHLHDDLPPDHPHLRDAVRTGRGWVHRHTFVIDDEHRVWPTQG